MDVLVNLTSLANGFGVVLTASNMLYAFAGVLIGTAIGVLPGLGPPATIAQTLLTSGHDAVNLKTYITGSIAPAPNALVTVAVLTHQSSSAAPSPTLSGGGMTTWEVVATVAYNGATPLDRLTIYRAMSPAPGSGPITISSPPGVSWIAPGHAGSLTSSPKSIGSCPSNRIPERSDLIETV